MTPDSRESVPGWLHAESLERVWARLGDALERRELVARGRVEISGLTREERHDLSDVLARPVTTEVVRVELDALEGHVAPRTGRDLAGVVGWILRRELVDRGAHRRDAARRRDAPFDAAREWLAGHARDHPAAPWVEVWLRGLRRDGLLTSVEGAARQLESALEVLAARDAVRDTVEAAESAAGVVARTDLAARVTGTSHGLDDGTRLAHLVLRAAAARASTGLPRTAADRRSLWESLGVVTDRVSSTCLVWDVWAQGCSGELGQSPTGWRNGLRHLTWWDLEREHTWAPDQLVLVCENPRTLEALADAQPAGLGVVCTMGRPNLVVRSVLAELRRADATLRYHGDFDWAGVSLANACVREFGAVPWLMGAGDYQDGHGSESLKGAAVEADWDPELAPAMRARGLAVHEEAVLDEVLSRVGELGPEQGAGSR